MSQVKPTQKKYYAFLQEKTGDFDCIDLSSMPENFAENFNAKKFARQIIDARSVNFMLYNDDRERFGEWITALQNLKSKLDPTEWAEVVKHLYPQWGISVLGGCPWGPHVFYNGGVAFRNYHRVQAIDFDSGIMLESLDWDSIRADMNAIFEKSEEDRTGLLWNGPNGIQWYQGHRQLPENLPAPEGGQMLLTTPSKAVAELPIFGNSIFMPHIKDGDLVAYRIFPERVIAYQLYRHHDKADTLMEEFSEFSLETEYEDSYRLNLSNDHDQLSKLIVERAREIAELISLDLDCVIPESLDTDLTEQFCSTDWEGWPRKIESLMYEFPTIFTNNWREAAPYAIDALIERLKLGKGEFAIESYSYCSNYGFTTPESVYNWFSTAKAIFDDENMDGYIVFAGKNTLTTIPLSAEEAIDTLIEHWLARVDAELQRGLQENPDYEFSEACDAIYDSENSRFLICGKSDTIFKIHRMVRRLTESTQVSNHLIISEIGLQQGYEPGNEWDSGNMDMFGLRRHESEDEDEDEDDYGDDDGDNEDD